MKKIFTIIIAATMAVSAWATDTNYSPTAEYNVRPLADGTGWKSTVEDGNASTKVKFEITAGACFYAIQQYKVSDIQNATSVTLTLTNYDASNGGSDALAIWVFNGTFKKDMSASDFNTAFKNTTGIDAGQSGTNTTTYLLKDVTTVKNPSKFTISGTALSQLKSLAAADGSFTLLITNKTADLKTASGTAKRYYQSSNSTNANPPVLTVTTPSYVVTNVTTGQNYTDLATAVTAAVANNVLQVNADVTVTSRVENSVAITIQGKKGTEKILRGTGLNALVFLPYAAITLKDIIIDGQNIERTCGAIEVSKDNASLVMNNVTIQNFAGTSTKILQVKKSCTVENCTFKDNAVASGYGDIYVGASNCLTLKGNNTIGNGIYVEKALYFNDGGTTHTTPITVIAASDRGNETNNGLGSNKAFIKGTTNTYKYTLSGTTSWDIAGNESQNYIYVTKAASVTKSSDKTMSAGGGYKIGTVTIE